MSSNKVFCPAPYIHFYHKGTKTGKICCIAKSTLFHKNRANETWTNSQYQQVREDMLAGISNSACSACYTQEEQGGYSDRQYFLKKYKDLDITYDKIIGNKQFQKPIDLDLRLSNLCNLGCRMCGPHYSSILEKASEELKELDGFANPTTSNSMLTDDDIDWLITDNPNIKRIKFLGGEPTIMNEVYKILDIIVDKQRQPQIVMTTNCTNVNKRFVEYLNYFKNTTINMSIDGTDKTLEYIRHPVKYNSVRENVIKLSKLNITDLNINYCIQALNINNLKSSIEFFAGLDKLDTVNSVIVDYPIGTSVYYLPVKFRKPYLEEALDNKHIDHPAFKKVFKAQLENIYKSDKELDMQKFLHRNMRFDQIRDQHLYDILPDLKLYIEEAIHKIGKSSKHKPHLIKHYIDRE